MPKSKGKERDNASSPITKKIKSNRAVLGSLQGNFKFPSDIIKKHKIPRFLSEIEAKYWKSEEKIIMKYFEIVEIPEDSLEQVSLEIIRVMKSVSNDPEVRSCLAEYCAAVAWQLNTDTSKKHFKLHFHKIKNATEIEQNEAKACMEAKVSSRILTTIETKSHKNELKKKLDMFEENDVLNHTNNTEFVTESFTQGGNNVDYIENPFMETEEYPSLKVFKERNLYKFQAPSRHIVSPNKPILQANDISVLKSYFDICISNANKEASKSTYIEYQDLMHDQKNFKCLKSLSGAYEAIIEILESNEDEIFNKVVALPKDNPFMEFVKYTMLDFILNCKRPGQYNDNDERSIFCEVMIPIFKAFGNCTGNLKYTWCEKKAKDSDYVWLVSNDFVKETKNNIKLLDGVGQMTISSIMNYLLIESSGFNNENILSHSLNDTLKNIKSGHDNLKCFVSNYRNSSFDTMKKISLFSCQIIRNKLSLIKYSIKSPSTWKVVECRSASIPLCFSEIIQYIKLFELFAFLLDDISKQKQVFQQLNRENLGIIAVDEGDTVAHYLL